MLQKIWYQTLYIHSTYWFDQNMFCPFFFSKTAFFGFQSNELYFLLFTFFFFLMNFFFLDEFKDQPTSVDKDKHRKSTNSKDLCLST